MCPARCSQLMHTEKSCMQYNWNVSKIWEKITKGVSKRYRYSCKKIWSTKDQQYSCLNVVENVDMGGEGHRTNSRKKCLAPFCTNTELRKIYLLESGYNSCFGTSYVSRGNKNPVTRLLTMLFKQQDFQEVYFQQRCCIRHSCKDFRITIGQFFFSIHDRTTRFPSPPPSNL